ncbi:MAG: hypothetical protein Hals2KO_39710 [Halioglobus sp.]
MSTNILRTLRLTSACLLTLSGTALIAALWLRELGETAVLDALLGATYLIIAIGLFGQSRFSLFVAAVIPGAVALTELRTTGTVHAVDQLRIAADTIVAISCAWILWRVRKEASQ